MFPLLPFQLLHLICITAAFAAKVPLTARNNNFVKVQDGQFSVNGSAFSFIGTNAYWLPSLEADRDIEDTLSSIAAVGIRVVRTWAFNDVQTIPQSGVWFQLISNNGTRTVNTASNGLQRLDRVVKLAEKHGIYLVLSLTNNWNALPQPNAPVDPSRPRNTLSNDYGGMDVYVRQLGQIQEHDQFYRNSTMINAFQDYTRTIVSRYAKSPAVFSWELANDPRHVDRNPFVIFTVNPIAHARCTSTLPASSSCNPNVITDWHATISRYIKSIDPVHLVSVGHQGFLCQGCPKRFSQPNASKRENRLVDLMLRNNQPNFPSLDGSFGIDSEDILAIPEVDVGSFQLFTDQNIYEPDNSTLLPLDNTLQKGLGWISRQGQISQRFKKPVTGMAFGLVTEGNLEFFTPFNESTAPFAPGQTETPDIQRPVTISDDQRNTAYNQWVQGKFIPSLSGLQSGLMMVQYQWGQTFGASQDVMPRYALTGPSPNDGHSTSGPGNEDFKDNMRQQITQLAS